jgi:hypothetical protein
MMIEVSDCAECSVTELAVAGSVRCGNGIRFSRIQSGRAAAFGRKSYEEIDMLFETKDD